MYLAAMCYVPCATLPGTSWGTLSERQKRLWDKLDCNTIDPELMRQKVRSKKVA